MSHMSWRTAVIYYLAVRWISLRPKPHLPANNQHFMKSEEDTDSSLTPWQPSTLRVALEHSHALEEHITRSQQSWSQLLKALDSTGTGLKAVHYKQTLRWLTQSTLWEVGQLRYKPSDKNKVTIHSGKMQRPGGWWHRGIGNMKIQIQKVTLSITDKTWWPHIRIKKGKELKVLPSSFPKKKHSEFPKTSLI